MGDCEKRRRKKEQCKQVKEYSKGDMKAEVSRRRTLAVESNRGSIRAYCLGRVEKARGLPCEMLSVVAFQVLRVDMAALTSVPFPVGNTEKVRITCQIFLPCEAWT